jgi:TolB-like protein
VTRRAAGLASALLAFVSVVAAMAAVAAAPARAIAAMTPTVAVMPFKDLSGQDAKRAGSIGEAIRETVTSDLKEVPGLRVIERGNIDKVLAEQNLQAARADLDPSSTVKIGKLLGATLIVAGAYQKAASQVRLTARFVKVETGEIVGTAKVDGAASDFLLLQDRVTTELLKSAGIEQKHVQKFAARPRPKLKSIKTVELYGDAVVEQDDTKKQELLKLALNEDSSFVYASRDLDALEKRLKALEARAQREQLKKVDELRAAWAKENDEAKRGDLQAQIFMQLLSTRMWLTLLVEAKRVLESGVKTKSSHGTGTTLDELALFYKVQAESMLKQHDAALRDGELFIAKHPQSIYFTGVKAQLESAIRQKREMEDGKGKVDDELKRLDSRERWNLCNVAHVYSRHHQWREAERLFRACIAVGTAQKWSWTELLHADIELGNWAQAKKDFAEIEKSGDKDVVQAAKGYLFQVPADG